MSMGAFTPLMGSPIRNYEELNLIASGAYGTVYRARVSDTGAIVALKKVRIPLTDEGIPMSTLREIALLKQLESFEHPNIVKLLDVCQGQQLEREGQLVLFLVFEHLEMDLAGYLATRVGGLPPMTLQRLSRELMTGIDFLHSHRIIHRDLKPQNLLISSNELLKIADFGLAKTYDLEMRLTSVVVTLWYRAPEILLKMPYQSSVDIWSAACIIFEMFQKAPLFPGSSEGNQLERIFELTGLPSQEQWPANISITRENFRPSRPKEPRNFCRKLCKYSNELLSQMLAFDHKDRPTAAQCLQHEYFTQEPLKA
ncbi:cyclin-dependent kinase 4 [Culicoides brevitarsis]|uniref:cyclin-dependent kinase 4 n=1 Tax=Culicoides brevitarsis TaxID=469753 RepID=UPI00307BFF5C